MEKTRKIFSGTMRLAKGTATAVSLALMVAFVLGAGRGDEPQRR